MSETGGPSASPNDVPATCHQSRTAAKRAIIGMEHPTSNRTDTRTFIDAHIAVTGAVSDVKNTMK